MTNGVRISILCQTLPLEFIRLVNDVSCLPLRSVRRPLNNRSRALKASLENSGICLDVVPAEHRSVIGIGLCRACPWPSPLRAKVLPSRVSTSMPSRVRELEEGQDRTREVEAAGSQASVAGSLRRDARMLCVPADFFIVAVPTPIDDGRGSPDLLRDVRRIAP